MAIKVKKYTKKISKGRESIYLDFYPAIVKENGDTTRREFLGMYVLQNPKTPSEKKFKKETLELAEQIRQRREIELNKPEVYNEYERLMLEKQKKQNESFTDFFRKLAEKRHGSNYDTWEATLKYFNRYAEEKDVRFKDVTKEFCEDFREDLIYSDSLSRSQPLSRNSASSYFAKFKAALREAFEDGFLETNVNRKIKGIDPQDSHREYLTLDEVRKLSQTACSKPVLKNACLFAAFTGLRYGDIQNLKWSDIKQDGTVGNHISLIDQKTEKASNHPIPESAVQFLGERRSGESLVFEGLKYNTNQNNILKDWISDADINKQITFHNFRHSYATILLSLGVALHEVQKLLGHRNIKTTQIYAKVIDENKRNALEKIKL